MILDHKTVIGDCLETTLGLKTYLYLINEVKNGNIATDDFKRKYNAYYRVRQRSDEWYKKYYDLMFKQKTNELTIEEIINELSSFGTIEASFASKLIATIDTQKPIWDQYVLKNLGYYNEWRSYENKSKEERIKKAVEIYKKIEKWYDVFLKSREGKKCILEFDRVLPKYSTSISDVKKIDFLLVNKR